jgi:hypothetical protein
MLLDKSRIREDAAKIYEDLLSKSQKNDPYAHAIIGVLDVHGDFSSLLTLELHLYYEVKGYEDSKWIGNDDGWPDAIASEYVELQLEDGNLSLSDKYKKYRGHIVSAIFNLIKPFYEFPVSETLINGKQYARRFYLHDRYSTKDVYDALRKRFFTDPKIDASPYVAELKKIIFEVIKNEAS